MLFSSAWGRRLSCVLSAVLEAGGLPGNDCKDEELR
jgi:hypothetical protein